MVMQQRQAPHLDYTALAQYAHSQPSPLLFVTISGAHLYGFESADSDFDLRGCHITPLRKMIGMTTPPETHEVMDRSGPVEIDLVTHDIRKFFMLLLKNNGYVLEQAASPLVVVNTPAFEELRSLLPGCITRQHRHHYLRFGQTQWEDVVKGGRPTVKDLLYTYRVLLAGIHLMRTGDIQSNLRILNDTFHFPYIDDLIAMKRDGAEKQELLDGLDKHEQEFNRLCAMLDAARDQSSLPDEPTARPALEDLLVRVRMAHLG